MKGGKFMINLNDVFEKVTDSWVSRVILDEVVIMPLCRSEEDVQYIYSISNETGARIWQILDGKHSVRNIQEVIKSEYKGAEENIEREVLEFLEDISGVGLIKKASQKNDSGLKVTASLKKKPYQRPEIAKVKMQPEQAVLSCCTDDATNLKTNAWNGMSNFCQDCMSPDPCFEATGTKVAITEAGSS